MRRAFVGVIAACVAAVTLTSPGSAVVNGAQVTGTDWSFMVAIGCSTASTAEACAGREFDPAAGMYRSQFCAGALISPTVVVTAAHCVRQAGSTLHADDLVVGGGSPSLAAMRDASHALPVISVTVDPLYSELTQAHDLALLRIAGTPADSTVIPFAPAGIALPDSSTARLAGWGDLLPGGPAPTSAQSGTITLNASTVCAEAYPGLFDSETMLCGSGRSATGIVDACRGDSGGPLVSSFGGSTRLVGIVSWGRGCASGRPGIYTRIATTLPAAIAALPSTTPIASGDVRRMTVVVTGEAWSVGSWSVLAERNGRPSTCVATVRAPTYLAICDITGLDEGGTYVVSAVQPDGTPTSSSTVFVNGHPTTPRVTAVTRIDTRGRAVITFAPARGTDATVQWRTVTCTAPVGSVRARSAKLTVTLAGLRPSANYRCTALASNALGASAPTRVFAVGAKRSTLPN